MKFNYKRTALCSLAFGWIALFWGSYDSFMQVVDYGVYGLSSFWHGVIVAADNILGLLFLPLFGRLSDNSKGERWGKRKPFIVGGTIVSMIGFSGVCIFASLGKAYFIPFLVCLIVTLASMAAYRSPALALVPDVNPDKYRSKANALSNAVSVVTTVVALGLFAGLMPPVFDNFYVYGAAMVAITIAMLIWFCIAVKEKKFRDDMLIENSCALDLEPAAPEEQQLLCQTDVLEDGPSESETLACSESHGLDVVSFKEDSLLHLPSFDSALQHESYLARRKERLEQKKAGKPSIRENIPFERFCILGAVFCFYMAYNALSSNFITYAEFVLNFPKGQSIIPLILAQLAAMLAFPLASYLANKIGRRNTILIGFTLMFIGFASSIAFDSPHPILYILFMVLGVSFSFTIVNIYPFFLENTGADKLGKDTGIFSVSMTLAMVVTPILSGYLIDIADNWFGGGEHDGFRILFPYCMLFLLIACGLTALIKSKPGDSLKLKHFSKGEK